MTPNTLSTPTPTSFLSLINVAIQRVCEKYPIARMEIFSLPATGLATLGSVMDLLVEFLPDATPGLLEMGALHEDLEQQLGCRVDLLSRRAVERSSNPFRRRAILTNAVTIYAR